VARKRGGVLGDASATGRRVKNSGEFRLGNGWLIELVEWACRTYGWSFQHVSYELPAIHLASLYRAYAQGPGGLRSGTLLEDEQAPDLLAQLPKPPKKG
jgi:hypothetical protein